ncbi:GNAT family N-acetyltransferase [Kovacikia minuta CCNUW1]|uniref:GNAT family N-acetyltransferase n=1 Tax=Kovacikia minuta TaxID=2931930 RepID=UPI001CCB8539|nr:GNAT family N-acetyltransferase [Kovacikia minuta]UBF25694.1 GNAT family N-acetyltransferase [Kovacikia minuta CCNUW1]
MNELVIKLAELPSDLPQIYRIRYLVFQIEQGVDPSLEFDGKDESSQHLLAYWQENAVGTTRIRMLAPKTAKIERVAVLPEVRGLGIGKQMMVKAIEILKSAQVSEVQMNAQEQVRDFYQKLGFEPEGAVFEEAGIPHVKMRKLLR